MSMWKKLPLIRTVVLSSTLVEAVDEGNTLRLRRFPVFSNVCCCLDPSKREDSPVKPTARVLLLGTELLDDVECLSEVRNDNDLLVRFLPQDLEKRAQSR